MPFSQNKFDRAVWKIVAGIKPGKVMSYGEVARRAGYPRHARMVSRAMCRFEGSLPWHRVVRSDRTLAFAAGSENYRTQKNLLQREGIRLINGKVILPESGSHADLDALIWGPDQD